ncbi:MAG: hypothetical protein B7Y39_08880 [Bdellovibrio sp. 28-41-41]|nr:MAG: hypothetical protein B7Y39_08880 [Bdellovibrio sp. 28-41-41]
MASSNITEKTLTILQLNDLHGYLEPHWEMILDDGSWSFKKLGGLSRIATMFKEVRKQSAGSVLTLDNGDTFHGTYISTGSKGRLMAPKFLCDGNNYSLYFLTL